MTHILESLLARVHGVYMVQARTGSDQNKLPQSLQVDAGLEVGFLKMLYEQYVMSECSSAV